MKIVHYKQIPPDAAGEEDALGVAIRWVITEKDGAPTFSMRVIEVEPGGYSPLHDHPWEHEVFILHGEGTLLQDGKATPVSPGDVIFIASGEQHQFKNTSNGALEFICLIPHVQRD